MKKQYEKPMVIVENFVLSDAVAGSCKIDVGFGDGGVGAANTCGYPDPDYGIMLFNDIHGPCEAQWDDGDDKGCYHIPVDGAQYFGS